MKNRLMILMGFIIIISLSFVNAQSPVEFYNINDDSNTGVRDTQWIAQGFRVGINGTNSFVLGNISIKAFRAGAGGLLFVNITEANSSGSPTGNSLATTTFDFTGLTTITPGVWINISLAHDNLTLELGNNYTLILYSNTSQNFLWRIEDVGGYEFQTLFSLNNGTSWGGTTSTAMFEIYSSGGLSVNLNSPIDNLVTIDTEILFNSTLQPTDTNLTNATLTIWYTNSSIFNETTNIVLGDVNNITTWNISNIPTDTFNWNVFGCGVGATTGITSCTYANSNFTFTVQSFSILDEFFNFNVSETDREEFEINISTVTIITSVNANLIYNGTSHPSSSTCDNLGFCNIRTNIDIPLIEGIAESQNKTFFWEITVFNSVNFITTNTTSNEQNVSRIHLEECNGAFTVQALNFTAFNEQNSTRVDPFTFDGTFNTWLGNGDVRRNDSFSNSSTSEFDLCISPPERDFFIDATIEYNNDPNSTLYQTRNYFFQNDTINNVTQHIPLNLLLSSAATSFILKVQDANLLALANVLIFSQRFDAGTGNFTTVQVAKTDDNGQSVGFFETETVDYRFLIKRNGFLLLQTSPQKMVGETAPFTLTFTVGEGAAKPWVFFEDLPDLVATLIFNISSNEVQFSYVDTSNKFELARLLVETQNFSIAGGVICDINLSQPSGILTCPVGNATGNYIASGFIDRTDGLFLVKLINFTIQLFVAIAGLLGVFLAWMIILMSSFAFKFNELAGIWLVNASVIFVNMLQLVSFGMIFIFGMLAVSIIITVLFNRAQ